MKRRSAIIITGALLIIGFFVVPVGYVGACGWLTVETTNVVDTIPFLQMAVWGGNMTLSAFDVTLPDPCTLYNGLFLYLLYVFLVVAGILHFTRNRTQ